MIITEEIQEYLITAAEKIINIDSPSGYTKEAVAFLKSEVEKMGYDTSLSTKGNLLVKVEGHNNNKTLGISAHIDTLGLMVRSIKSDGKLAFTKIGGPLLPTLDGEYCRIITRDKKVYTGTILSTSPSVHVYADAGELKRVEDTMEIRLDELVYSKEDVLKLGIQNGDIIAIDPKFTCTGSGFIKSRFLDDKISSAIILAYLKYLSLNDQKPANDLQIIFSTYEEVGHGAASLPEKIDELLAIDMGCIGKDLSCNEEDVSICAKDSSGPYDYDIVSRLLSLAKDNNLKYAIDIYPYYGSDVSSALRGGNDIKGALIGPGVSASHGMERTHRNALLNTLKLLIAYTK